MKEEAMRTNRTYISSEGDGYWWVDQELNGGSVAIGTFHGLANAIRAAEDAKGSDDLRLELPDLPEHEMTDEALQRVLRRMGDPTIGRWRFLPSAAWNGQSIPRCLPEDLPRQDLPGGRV